MTVNLFTAAGYFLFSGIGGFGDWAVFIQGFSPQWAWRTGMAIFGAATYTLAAWFSLLELRPLIGSDSRGASNQGPLLCGRNSGFFSDAGNTHFRYVPPSTQRLQHGALVCAVY